MKISYAWLKDYIDHNYTPKELSDALTQSGLEVESVELFEMIEGGLSGVVVGEVMSLRQHPNADRLRVCEVNVGAAELLQIVCGAPNVAQGQKVPVALIGTTLHPAEGDPIVLKKSKIRGEESQGMICAEDELGIGLNHEGIMILNENIKLGTPVSEVLGMETDHVLEIGLTANRADATSHFGVARDVAALLRKKAVFPKIASAAGVAAKGKISIKVEDTVKCPRYSGIYIEGVTIGESPDWMKRRLKAIGLRPINNIVDITNYVLHETGQPLHAFDADKIGGNSIIVKTLPADSKFKTLDEQERQILRGTDLMICDGEKPVAIAGIMGGLNSEVSPETKNIFLESAYFSVDGIRKTAKRLGLKTDASYRFERGADPDMTLNAGLRAALLIVEIAGGKILSVEDQKHKEFPPYEIEFDLTAANRMMGREFSQKEIEDILSALEIQVKGDATKGKLQIKVPQYRVDVQRPQDIMEEILRIYGYNNIPRIQQANFSIKASGGVDPFHLRNQYLNFLAASGYREIVTNPLVPANQKSETSVSLINTLSEDLAVMRENMLGTGLNVIEYNHNRKNTNLKLVEFGKTYQQVDGKYEEQEWVALYMTGMDAPSHWAKKSNSLTIFSLSAELERMQKWFGFQGEIVELDDSATFAYGLGLKAGEKIVARIGSVHPDILKDRDIREEVFFAIADWSALLKLYRKSKVVFKEIPRFPSIIRDISMIVPEGLGFSSIAKEVKSTNPKLIREIGITDVYRGDKIEQGKKSYLIHLTLLDDQKTLTDETADQVMKKVYSKLEDGLSVIVRK